jgi:hypothetical protein
MGNCCCEMRTLLSVIDQVSSVESDLVLGSGSGDSVLLALTFRVAMQLMNANAAKHCEHRSPSCRVADANSLGSTGAMTQVSIEKCQWHKSWHVTSEYCAADLFFRAACVTSDNVVAVRRLVTREKRATRKRPRNQAEDNRSFAIPPPSVALASDLIRPDSTIWLGDPNRRDKEGSVEELALFVWESFRRVSSVRFVPPRARPPSVPPFLLDLASLSS